MLIMNWNCKDCYITFFCCCLQLSTTRTRIWNTINAQREREREIIMGCREIDYL